MRHRVSQFFFVRFTKISLLLLHLNQCLIFFFGIACNKHVYEFTCPVLQTGAAFFEGHTRAQNSLG